MAGLTIVAKLIKLAARKKTTEGLIKNAIKKKLPVTKLKYKDKMLDKSIKRLEAEQAAARTTSKDDDFLTRKMSNRKKQLPDGSQSIGVKNARDRSLLESGSTMRKAEFMSVRKKKILKLEELEEAGKLTPKQKEELTLMRASMAGMKRRGNKATEDRVSYIKPVVKKAVGGKVYSNIVSRKTGGAIGVGAALRGFGKGYKKG